MKDGSAQKSPIIPFLNRTLHLFSMQDWMLIFTPCQKMFTVTPRATATTVVSTLRSMLQLVVFRISVHVNMVGRHKSFSIRYQLLTGGSSSPYQVLLCTFRIRILWKLIQCCSIVLKDSILIGRCMAVTSKFNR